MGKPHPHIPVKLIVGLIFGKRFYFIRARHILEKKFGKVEAQSPEFDFSCTDYYADELGHGLKRVFLSFKQLIVLKNSYQIKLFTNRIEKKLSNSGLRTVNIDPGYISLSKLVLFTTKNRSHRIYLDKGIYADLELTFEDKTFRPLKWAYPDCKSGEYIDFFNLIRADYYKQIKKVLA